MTKICESFAGGFAPVAGDLDYPEQPMQRVLHAAKVREVAKFIGGLLAVSARLRAIRVAQGNRGIICKPCKAA